MPYKAYAISFNQDPDVFDSLIIEAKNGNEISKAMLEAKEILEFNKNAKNLYVTNAVSNDIESFDKILSTLSIFCNFSSKYLTTCWRYWSHEYNACYCCRKNKRDRD